MSIFIILISYLNIDPLKSSFFLIFSLLFSLPLITFRIHIWFSYFVCLLFLRGIFVILVYFSSLSKFGLNKNYFWYICLFIRFFLFVFCFCFFNSNLSLVSFYFEIYFVLFCFILFSLLLFINFRRYFLNFSGALRKI